MDDERHIRRATFDSTAELYDAARPEYPPRLFADLIALASLEPGDRLLEIGCGTGKASRPLLEAGFTVVCVELGEALARRARRNLAGLSFEAYVAPFEEWEGGRGAWSVRSRFRGDRLALARHGCSVWQGARAPAPRRPPRLLERAARVSRRLRPVLH